MNRNFAVSILIIASLSLVSSMVIPEVYATGQEGKWSARPYFQLAGNATSSPKGLDTTQVWSAYGFSKMNCAMTSTVGWDYVNLCGHGKTIAIVDAYDDPTIENDLATFDGHWGLPDCNTSNGCFEKVTIGNTTSSNSTWALEESLDVEWAHATAPGAKIVLVESRSNNFRDLMHSINYTETKTGASQISMGWGVPEFQNETKYDSNFAKAGISFFAPSGNGNSHLYPSASPYVISVGGTTLNVATSGSVKSETAWSASSGGESYYEQEPQYQMIYGIDSDNKRTVPDVSYDANPQTGFPVYDSTLYNNQTGWFLVGGTSAGVPQWAAIAAIANSQGAGLSSYRFAASSDIYTAATGTLYSSNYRDITQGGTTLNQAITGYDFASGLGSPISNNIVSFLSPKPTAPSIPLNMTATASNQQISLTWKAPSFTGGLPITKYHIYRGTAIGGEMILNVIPPTNQSYVDPWLENGQTYYYYVTAVNAAEESHGSNEAYATPETVSSAPRALVASMTGGQVSLTWQPPSYTNGAPITKYNIYRGTSLGQEIFLTSISNSIASYADTTMENDQTYYYYVTAVNIGGESIPSNEVSITEPAVAPTFPQNLVAVATSKQITLTWLPPASIGGSPIIKYNIYGGITAGHETFLSSVPPNVSYFTNSYVVNGATYYYYVTAVNAMGESQKSDEVSAIPGQ
ncbi:MAG: fibronectin type III domain-containing protein [Nitrosotalea sp.]